MLIGTTYIKDTRIERAEFRGEEIGTVTVFLDNDRSVDINGVIDTEAKSALRGLEAAMRGTPV